jgi:hypothetical protein
MSALFSRPRRAGRVAATCAVALAAACAGASVVGSSGGAVATAPRATIAGAPKSDWIQLFNGRTFPTGTSSSPSTPWR